MTGVVNSLYVLQRWQCQIALHGHVQTDHFRRSLTCRRCAIGLKQSLFNLDSYS